MHPKCTRNAPRWHIYSASKSGWADVSVSPRLVISSFCVNGGLVALPMRAPVG
jgi:hypothetical protein